MAAQTKALAATSLVLGFSMIGVDARSEPLPASKLAPQLDNEKCRSRAKHITDQALLGLIKKDSLRLGTMLGRDQFLTDQANKERLAKLLRTYLAGSDVVTTRYRLRAFQVSFNADSGLMSMWSPTDPGPTRGPSNYEYSRIGRILARKGQYVGQNSFGATAKINRVAIINATLGYPHSAILKRYRTLDNIFSIAFPISLEQAKAFLSNPSIIISGSLTDPYVAQSSFFPTPTLAEPIEGVVTDVAFYIQPQCVMLLAGEEVIGRLDQ